MYMNRFLIFVLLRLLPALCLYHCPSNKTKMGRHLLFNCDRCDLFSRVTPTLCVLNGVCGHVVYNEDYVFLVLLVTTYSFLWMCEYGSVLGFVAWDANRLILQCWPRCSVKTFNSSYAAGLGAPYGREYSWRYYYNFKTLPS